MVRRDANPAGFDSDALLGYRPRCIAVETSDSTPFAHTVRIEDLCTFLQTGASTANLRTGSHPNLTFLR